ncbi:50S ribosomal protein L31 [Streptomyces sp. NPDC020362]
MRRGAHPGYGPGVFSHPFCTGTARVLDTVGRVERFDRRYGKRGGA